MKTSESSLRLKLSHRRFLGTTANALAAVSIVPTNVFGGYSHPAPGEGVGMAQDRTSESDTIRIRAGAISDFTDDRGRARLRDTTFTGGKAIDRGGNPLTADIQTWHKAENENVRTETGIIHKQIAVEESGLVKTHLIYTDGTGIEISTTPSPYFQTWFCNGGKGSKEFTDINGVSLLQKNWDGVGIEIGSSPLDHNGNIDETVVHKQELMPGESKRIDIVLSGV